MASTHATKEAFKVVPETCPAVDDALSVIAQAVDDAEGLIKRQTNALRDALISAIDRAIYAEDTVDELKDKVKSLENTISNLEHDLASRLDTD